MDTKEYTERLQNRRNNPFLVGFFLFFVIAFWIFTVVCTTLDIHAYSKEGTTVTGRLEAAIQRGRTFDLRIDGDAYTLSKDNHYSSRSFGVLDNMSPTELAYYLERHIGHNVSLEYVPLTFGKKGIIELTINDREIVNKDVAVEDFIEDERYTRRYGTIFCLVAVGLFLFALECRK